MQSSTATLTSRAGDVGTGADEVAGGVSNSRGGVVTVPVVSASIAAS